FLDGQRHIEDPGSEPGELVGTVLDDLHACFASDSSSGSWAAPLAVVLRGSESKTSPNLSARAASSAISASRSSGSMPSSATTEPRDLNPDRTARLLASCSCTGCTHSHPWPIQRVRSTAWRNSDELMTGRAPESIAWRSHSVSTA